MLDYKCIVRHKCGDFCNSTDAANLTLIHGREKVTKACCFIKLLYCTVAFKKSWDSWFLENCSRFLHEIETPMINFSMIPWSWMKRPVVKYLKRSRQEEKNIFHLGQNSFFQNLGAGAGVAVREGREVALQGTVCSLRGLRVSMEDRAWNPALHPSRLTHTHQISVRV